MLIDFIFLFIIVFVAALLQAGTGYGFSIIGTPFLLLFYPAHEAIQINIILSIFLSVFMLSSIKGEIDKLLLIALIKGSVIGAVVGIFIYIFVDVQWLTFIVGIVILILTMMLILQVQIKRTDNRDFTMGSISGLLTTSIGVPGPPLLLYFSSISIDRYTLRSTTLAYYLFIYTLSLIMQVSLGGTNTKIWSHAFIGIPALLVGILFGQIFIKWISQKTFRFITYIILLFTGIYLLITSF